MKKIKYIFFSLVIGLSACDNDTLEIGQKEVATNVAIETTTGVLIDEDTGLPQNPSTLTGEPVIFKSLTDNNLLTGREWQIDYNFDTEDQNKVLFKTFRSTSDDMLKDVSITFEEPNKESLDRTSGGFNSTLREFFKDGRIETRLAKIVVRDPISIEADDIVNSSKVSKGSSAVFRLPSNPEDIGLVEEDAKNPDKMLFVWELDDGRTFETKFYDQRFVTSFDTAGKYNVTVTVTRNWPAKSSFTFTKTDAIEVADGRLLNLNSTSVSERGKKISVSYSEDIATLDGSEKDLYDVFYKRDETNISLPIESVSLNPTDSKIIEITLEQSIPSSLGTVNLTYKGAVESADGSAIVACYENVSIDNPFGNLLAGKVYDDEILPIGANTSYGIAGGQPLAAGESFTISNEETRPGTTGNRSFKLVKVAGSGTTFAVTWGAQDKPTVGPGTYIISYWAKASSNASINTFIATPELGWNKPDPGFWRAITTEWQKYESVEITLTDADGQLIPFHHQFAGGGDAGYTLYLDDIEMIKIDQ